MDHITIYNETGLLICKDCKFALIPSRINRHFTRNPHNLKPYTRKRIQEYISTLNTPNLITEESEITSRIKLFLESFD